MKLWLTRQRDGAYMLTMLRPVTEIVRGTGELDAYLRPGEPVGIRHLCAGGVAGFFGPRAGGLGPCESLRIRLTGEVLG